MTNKNLRADLISEIENIERFVRDLPLAVREQHNFDDRPVTVQFGPDVETVFAFEDGRNMVRGSNKFDPLVLVADIHRELQKQEIVMKPTELDEDDFVEIRLRPASALKLCRDYERSQDVLQQAADHVGAQAHGISAHWHMSVVQDGHDQLFIGPVGSYSPSLLAEDIAQNMVDMQRRFPAFFIRPFRAEQNPTNMKRYAGPREVKFDNTKGHGTVNFSNLSRPVATVEPRISPDDPYQAAYLYLKSLENAFVGEPVSLDAGAPAVRRGSGGYLHMLEQTAESLAEQPPEFPPHVSDGMMRASIAGYERYFEENSKAKPDDIENLDQRLWSLKQQFPEPAEDKADLDMVVS